MFIAMDNCISRNAQSLLIQQKKEQRKDKAALYPDLNMASGPVDRSYLEDVGWAELFVLATLRLTLPLLAQPNNPGH